MPKLSNFNSVVFIVGIVILNLALFFSINVAADQGIEVTAPESVISSNKSRVCKPDLACIAKEALPRWSYLTEYFLKPISSIAQQEINTDARVNNEVTKRIAELLETYLTIYKGDKDISCALEAECLTILEMSAINFAIHAFTIPNCHLARNRICGSDEDVNKWLEEIVKVAQVIIRTNRN